MNFEKVFVDANIFLDLFDTTRPMSDSSVRVLEGLADSETTTLFTSCDLVTTVYYLGRKIIGTRAQEALATLEQICEILPFGNCELRETLSMMREDRGFTDLEDALQYRLAKKADCELILSNDRSFHSPEIPLYRSDVFAERYLSA